MNKKQQKPLWMYFFIGMAIHFGGVMSLPYSNPIKKMALDVWGPMDFVLNALPWGIVFVVAVAFFRMIRDSDRG